VSVLIERVKVIVPSEITNEFKKKAKSVFPNEAFAYLLGHDENDVVVVDELFFPKDVDSFCTPTHVLMQWAWEKEAKRRAKKIGCKIVGDWHSHPYTHDELTIEKRRVDLAPSQQDWEAFQQNKLQLMGLCVVTETKNKRLRTQMKFWGPVTPLLVKET